MGNVNMDHLLVTGGAGFIGSNYVRMVLREELAKKVTVLDALTYAGNLENLKEFEGDDRLVFVHGKIQDREAVDTAAKDVDVILNFAAESHNDRAILDPDAAVQANFNGVCVLLDAARRFGHQRFLQVSTDEVYGSTDDMFREGDALEPNQPYSAAKAGGELMVRAYHETFGLQTLVTRGSNTYGQFQYPEKLIPLMVTNAIDDIPLPVYGDGQQVREWMHVDDHARGIDLVLRNGVPGKAYNLGSGCERVNLDVVKGILAALGKPDTLIRNVEDRPGHDRRYLMECKSIRALGFDPDVNFEARLEETVKWYVENESWWRRIKEKKAEYQAFMDQWYANRRG
jgi:dTDP-glucose 4,6-dehydratase